MSCDKIQGKILKYQPKEEEEQKSLYDTIEGFCSIISITSLSKPYTKKNDDVCVNSVQ
jgi:hypothetical protein